MTFRHFLSQIVAAFCALAIITGGLHLWNAEWVWAAIPAPGAAWDAAYEASPGNAEPVSEGDDEITHFKTATRDRLEAELDFGTIAGGSDNGRLRLGAARPFWADAAPANLAVADFDASNALDDARLWIDTNDGGTLYAYDDNGVGTDLSNEAADAFYPLTALPTNAIILWAEANGDEDCDGADTAGDCPCGFTRDDEFDSLTVRGADADVTDIPTEVGVICDNQYGGLVDPLCDGTNPTEYNDINEANELPQHLHVLDQVSTALGSAAFVEDSAGPDAADLNTANAGVLDPPHYHPFKTVLFCKKN